MGPSHTFFLLLVFSAYAFGMPPQDPSTQPNNAGSPTNSATSQISAFATPPGSNTAGPSSLNIPNDISSFLNGIGASNVGGTGGTAGAGGAGVNPGAQPTMQNPYPTQNNFYPGQPTGQNGQSPYTNPYQTPYSAQAQYGNMYAAKTPNMHGPQPPKTMQDLYAQAAQYGQQKPMYGQTPKYGQQTSMYGRQAPNMYGQPNPSMYGQQNPGMYAQQNTMYRTQTPMYAPQYPMYGQQPMYGPRTPIYGQQPRYGQYTPYDPYQRYGTTRNPWSPYPSNQHQHQPRPGSGTTTGPTSNQGSTTPKNPMTGYVDQLHLQRKESWNSKLMSHYKNQYGCVEALKYIPSNVRFQVAGQFSNGCGARSNMTCGTATMNRNPRVVLNRRFMSPQRLKQIETALNYMDLYTAIAQRSKQTGGKAGNAAMNPMGAMGAMAGAGAMGAMGAMGGAGGAGAMGAMFGAGAMGAMGQMGGAASMFNPRGMTGGGGRPGMGSAISGALIMSDIAGMEVPEAREKYLPYQCQEMGVTAQTKIGMCCPGAVELLPEHQAAIGLRGAM